MGIVTTSSAWPTNLILIVNQTCGSFFKRMEMECRRPVIIKKKLNNNAVIIKSKRDVILMEKGIGYLVKPGDKVVVYLTRTLNKNIYDVALTNHIYYTIKRDNEGLIMNTSLLWEVKNIYPEEYAVALTILHKINQEFSMNLPNEKARILSFHILANEENDHRSTNVTVSVQIVNDILNIVKYFFDFTYDQKSVAYTRFIVYLKFLTKRILHHEQAYLTIHIQKLILDQAQRSKP